MEKPVSLRKAELGDVDVILAIEHELFGVEAWPRRDITYYIHHPESVFKVACDQSGAIVAYCMYLREGPNMHIGNMAVRTAHQGRGLGKYLMQDMVDDARSGGYVRIYLEVARDNAGAMRLYQSFGFSQCGVRPGYYPSGQDALILEVRVAASDSPPAQLLGRARQAEDQGLLDEAERLFKHALSESKQPESKESVGLINDLARVLAKQSSRLGNDSKLLAAEDLLERAARIAVARYPDDPIAARVLLNKAAVHTRRARSSKSAGTYRELAAILLRRAGQEELARAASGGDLQLV